MNTTRAATSISQTQSHPYYRPRHFNIGPTTGAFTSTLQTQSHVYYRPRHFNTGPTTEAFTSTLQGVVSSTQSSTLQTQ